MTAQVLSDILNFPVLVFTCSVVALWLFAHSGALMRTRLRGLGEEERQDFGVVIGATLTLLGLLIGFTFSMAISRYDQRKNYEEEEANAIGTEYFRADMLPATNAATVHELLVKYLDQRVLFYDTVDERLLVKIDSDTTRLEREMWSEVRAAAAAQPTPTIALVVAGMNDVLNTQGYTQAAWWNRIPTAAWILMVVIAICCNLLIGYAAHRSNGMAFLVLPLAVSVSFLLIADIDSPRGGLIRVLPHNLVSLAQSLTAPSDRSEP
jgi:hypothetical protein